MTTCAALLQTAMDMLAEEQGWQFTLRELARRAGVTMPRRYKHFDGKAALLAELAVQGFDKLRDALLATRSRSPGDSRRLFSPCASLMSRSARATSISIG